MLLLNIYLELEVVNISKTVLEQKSILIVKYFIFLSLELFAKVFMFIAITSALKWVKHLVYLR